MSPDGTVFKSVRLALEHLFKLGQISHAAIIRDHMINIQGWKKLVEAENILYKQAKQEYTFLFVSEDGLLFNSRSKIKEYLTKQGKLTSTMAVALQNIFTRKQKKSLMVRTDEIKLSEARIFRDPNWNLDESLPNGWKSKPDSRTKSGNKSILSPEGMCFQSKIKAFKYLCDNGSDVQHEMRSCLIKHEQWLESQLLPTGWLFKKDFCGRFYFVTNKGLQITSLYSAWEYVQRTCVENKDVIDKFKIFMNENKQVSNGKSNIVLKEDWQEDPSLPLGWKLKSHEVNMRLSQLLSPNGVRFWGIIPALKDLIEKNAENSDIEKMRKRLTSEHEGYQEHELLPKKWLFKKFSGVISFLSEKGIVIYGFKNAYQLVKKDSEEWGKLNKLEIEISEKDPQSNKILHKQNLIFEEIQKILSAGTTEERQEARKTLIKRGWVENDFLPDNWLLRKGNRGIFQVITNDGHILKSFKHIIGHLMKFNDIYSKEDINRFKRFPDGQLDRKIEALIQKELNSEQVFKPRKFSLKQYRDALIKDKHSELTLLIKKYFLTEEGWKEDSSVTPENWLFKQKPGKRTVMFLTENGDFLTSVDGANRFLKNNQIDFLIDSTKFAETFDDNYELQLKKIERAEAKQNRNPPGPVLPNLPSTISVTKVQNRSQNSKPQQQQQNLLTDKFSLTVLDMERNRGISNMKSMFDQLQRFKEKVGSNDTANPSDASDFDLDQL